MKMSIPALIGCILVACILGQAPCDSQEGQKFSISYSKSGGMYFRIDEFKLNAWANGGTITYTSSEGDNVVKKLSAAETAEFLNIFEQNSFCDHTGNYPPVDGADYFTYNITLVSGNPPPCLAIWTDVSNSVPDSLWTVQNYLDDYIQTLRGASK